MGTAINEAAVYLYQAGAGLDFLDGTCRIHDAAYSDNGQSPLQGVVEACDD